MLGSPHRDVLEATPDTDESKARLVEELKLRAKSAVSRKDWRNASLLYEKAITLQDHEAALHSNLSLCQYSMGGFETACTSAEQAIKVDIKYVKGHWRLGQALQQLFKYKEALQVYQKAIVYDPTNKAIQKEMIKLKKLVEEQKEKNRLLEEAAKLAKEEAEKMERAAPPVATAPAAAVEPKKTTTTSTTTNTATPMTTDDNANFTKSDHVKGYKVVNGKKTSYFHNELTDEAKALIGDIAPKRIEIPVSTNTAQGASGSAWNKAGTWEEKDVTVWAKESLKKALLQTQYTLAESSPAPGAQCIITSFTATEGNASFAMVRGKKNYIYEFSLELKWEFTVEDDKASGSLTFPDFDGTCELGQGYDMTEWKVKDCTSSNLTPLLERFVKNGGLRDAIHETLDDWVRLFRETY